MLFTIHGKQLNSGEAVEVKISAADARAAGWAAAERGIQVIRIVPAGDGATEGVASGGAQQVPTATLAVEPEQMQLPAKASPVVRIAGLIFTVAGLVLLVVGIAGWVRQSAEADSSQKRSASVSASARHSRHPDLTHDAELDAMAANISSSSLANSQICTVGGAIALIVGVVMLISTKQRN